MARDRKRAKQRRERGAGASRRAATAAPDAPSNGARARTPGQADGERAAEAPAPGSLERVDVPGALDHASADVDEFDAAIVRGAGGVPAAPDTDTRNADEFDPETEDALQEPAAAAGGGSGPGAGAGGGGASGAGGGGGGSLERPSGAPLRGGNKAIGFLRASWAELQRVQWPDRRHVFQATAVVLGFVAVAGAYLGLADYVAKEIVEFIL
ncbi:MAG: preprotein translocase subunit SecE [Solirubrobacteraceae bacterium]